MVAIGLIGLPGSGKASVAEELCNGHGFQIIQLKQPNKLELASSAEDVSEQFESLQLKERKCFGSLAEAADHVMTNWKQNFVIIGLECNEDTLELFSKRPIFVLMLVTAPISERFSRIKHKLTLEQLIIQDDQFNCNPTFPALQETCKVIFNNNADVPALKQALQTLDLASSKWIRPSWDFYFMRLAELASQRSNCMKRRVGAVIVKDCKVIATGYNGTARHLLNCSEGGCPRCNRNEKCGLNLDECLCLHGEENALLEAGAMRCQDATIYSTSSPCLGCCKRIIQVGIKRVVFRIDYSLDHNSKALFESAGVTCEKLPPAPLKYYSCKAQ